MGRWLFLGAVNGGLAVLLGAFAAHGLSTRLDAHSVGVFETGARYHMYHALALCMAALMQRDGAAALARWASRAFFAGIILFSGSLYLLALTGIVTLGLVTPFGGLCFLAAWTLLALAARKL